MNSFVEQIISLQSEDPAQVEETEGHWVHLLKIGIVCFKVIFIATFLTFAICAYKAKNENLPNRLAIICLLTFKIVILVGLMILDFTTQYISAFFLLGMGSCFCTFATLQIILGDVQTESGRSLRRKFRPYSVIMCLLFLATCGMAFSYRFGAFCDHSTVYPLIMQCIPIFYVINTIFCMWLKHKKYYLTWDEKENHLLHAEAEHGVKDLFEKRMETYLCYSYVVAPIQVLIFFIGRFAVGDHRSYLGCYDGGWQWKYHSVVGSLFTFALIAVCFMQAVMLEKVFYSIPHHMGYFETNEIYEHAAKTAPLSGSARKSDQVDDDYTKINEA